MDRYQTTAAKSSAPIRLVALLGLRAAPFKLMLAAAALGIAVAAAPQASAVALYSADAPCVPGVQNSTTPVDLTVPPTCRNDVTSITGEAVAQPGHLGVGLAVVEQAGGNVSASALFSDQITFSPTNGSTALTIPVALNLKIAGGIAAAGSFATQYRVLGGLGTLSFDVEGILTSTA
jgi:hypothetical protein